MKAIAKKTSYMEGYMKGDINRKSWITKDNIYVLELLYRFIDDEGDEHFLLFEDFEEFFSNGSNVRSEENKTINIISQWLQNNGFEEASKAIDCEFEL